MFDLCKPLIPLPFSFWVRNILNQPAFSSRFPLADGYLYPDFVAELKDGRILVVEYKGAHLLEGA